MNVAELIAFLQTQPQDLQVGYKACSEYCLLMEDEIEVVNACEPRADDWIQRQRPDKPSRAYLMFPGN